MRGGWLISAEEKRTVLVLGTLDTKSREIGYLRDRILESGLQVIVLDNGVLGEPQGVVPDISAGETAIAAGTTLEQVRKAPSRGAAIDEMIKGCKVLVKKLYDEGRIHGAISFGGAEGGVMASAAMQVLPPGFPKIVITPLASGVRPFGPFVGIRDMMVMHSLIDIVGINDISRSVFDNASQAIIGMAKGYKPMEIRGKRMWLSPLWARSSGPSISFAPSSSKQAINRSFSMPAGWAAALWKISSNGKHSAA